MAPNNDNQDKLQTHRPTTLKQKIRRYASSGPLKNRRFRAATAILLVVLVAGAITATVQAEVNPGTSVDNGLTSRLMSLNNTLTGLGYGSTTNTPDWGAFWNRISTAAQWTPAGNAAASDVKSGQTFYGNNRTQKTGTYPAPSSCSTEAYHDSYGAPVTQTTNCTANITWTVRSPAVTGDDNGTGNTDARTGLTWSEYLTNNSGTVAFATSGASTWTWDASGTANVAVGNQTAVQLCSGMGNGWRLPTQKELMQAYIDGSYFNLSNPSYNFWSATQYSSTNAWYVLLSSGGTSTNVKTTGYYVRCVR